MQLFSIQQQFVVPSYTKITIQVKNLILFLSQTCRMTSEDLEYCAQVLWTTVIVYLWCFLTFLSLMVTTDDCYMKNTHSHLCIWQMLLSTCIAFKVYI